MGLALPLLVAAGLGVLGIHRFLNGPQGYDPDNLLVMRMVLSDPRYEENDPARRQLVERVLAGLAALPGVERAAAVNVLPAAGGNSSPAVRDRGPAAGRSGEPADRGLAAGHARLLRDAAPADRRGARIHRRGPRGRRAGGPGQPRAGGALLPRRRRHRPPPAPRRGPRPGRRSSASPATTSTTGSGRRNYPTVFRPLRAGAEPAPGAGGAHAARPGGAGQRRARGAARRRSRAAGLRPHADARPAQGEDGRPPVHRGDHGGLRGAGAAPRDGRRLRGDGLPRLPAHARDRRPHGARRHPRRRRAARGLAGGAADRAWAPWSGSSSRSPSAA